MSTDTLNAAGLRADHARRGRILEYITIIWNSLEGIIAIGAGIVAGSIALVGFGVDSVIEVSSGAIILWRLASGEHREQLALRRQLSCTRGLCDVRCDQIALVS